MVCVLASTGVVRGFKPQWGKTKDYKIGICCLSHKHAALRRKSKDWLCLNVLFSEQALLKSNSACWSSTKQTSSSSHQNITFSRHDITEK